MNQVNLFSPNLYSKVIFNFLFKKEIFFCDLGPSGGLSCREVAQKKIGYPGRNLKFTHFCHWEYLVISAKVGTEDSPFRSLLVSGQRGSFFANRESHILALLSREMVQCEIFEVGPRFTLKSCFVLRKKKLRGLEF